MAPSLPAPPSQSFVAVQAKGKVLHLLKGGLRLATAEVGQGPGGITLHGQLAGVLQLLEQGHQCSLLQHHVPALRGVAGDVAQCPDRLLSTIATSSAGS